MWRSDDFEDLPDRDARRGPDDGAATAARLARVVPLPPDETEDNSGQPAYPWDGAFEPRRRQPGRDPVREREERPGGGRLSLAAFDPGRRGVRVLLAVAGLVVCLSAGIVWWSRPRVSPAPVVGGASAVAVASGTPALLVVSVTGRVNRPGLVRLPAGSRVADAIEAAGGVVAGVDLTGVNLARKVVDGEMIAIGVTPPPATAGAGRSSGGLVNLNTATATELQALPGIGAVLAQRIVEFRDGHGGFRAVSDLRQVEGIGDAKFQQLKDRVTV